MDLRLIYALVLAVLFCLPRPAFAAGPIQIPVTLTGGYDTFGPDRGRPVVLIAAALGVPDQVFRDAFSHVHPAPPGEQPQEAQVRLNKAALMSALGPYGVTDDRLNEVSNYYRYRREEVQLWRHVPAVVMATVQDGVVIGFIITSPGAGYTTPPTITVPGYPVKATVKLSLGKDLANNGSVSEVSLAK